MITKTLGTILIAIVCILMFPIAFVILGGTFGIVIGVIGAVFGAVAGIIGAAFGAIFGVFDWMFDGLFDWHWPFGFLHCDGFTLAVLIVIVALMVRGRSSRQ
jgi:hypothetical protein